MEHHLPRSLVLILFHQHPYSISYILINLFLVSWYTVWYCVLDLLIIYVLVSVITVLLKQNKQSKQKQCDYLKTQKLFQRVTVCFKENTKNIHYRLGHVQSSIVRRKIKNETKNFCSTWLRHFFIQVNYGQVVQYYIPTYINISTQ